MEEIGLFASVSSCSLMFFLYSNPLKALSQTALTSTGQAFVSPERCLKEKDSALLVLVAIQVFVLKRFSPCLVKNVYSIILK